MVPPNKLGPDLNGKAVNVTQYRGMISSLMYLTASRPDIQFSTCLYARYQANPKESHLIVVKRIFRDHILKGVIKLHFIPTHYQIADIFTKPLDEPTFKRLIVKLEVKGLILTPYKVGGLFLPLIEPEAVSLPLVGVGLSTSKPPHTLWKTGKYLPHSSMYVPLPYIIVVRPWFAIIGYSEEIGTKGTLKKSFLPPRWRLLMDQIIQYLGGKTVIMEYLVKISKKARILELKRRHLKIIVLTSYTLHPSRKIRRIYAGTLQETTKIQRPIRRSKRLYGRCMIRSLTKELLTPFKELEREFRSSMKLFKTLSLDKSRSPEFNLFSDIEENFEEEVAETMEVILFYNGLDVPTRQILDSKCAIPTKTVADAKEQRKCHALSNLLNLGLDKLAHTKLTVELADRTMKYPKGIAKNVLVRFGKFVLPVDFIILDIHEDVKVPLILERPFLSTAHTKIDVFKRKITLRVGDEKIIFKSMKHASSLIKRVYMLGLREHMELDLEARLMGENLVLNRSLEPLYGDYIELNDLNIPLELRRDQVDDLIPTIEEGEVIDEPVIEIIKTRNNESFDEYPSFCDFDQKININCAYNLRFSCMIVVENMDGYRDQEIGDAIFGEPFCKASYVEEK
ncbi:gag-pol polyprotein, partial [Tanacetum coccineum]